MAMLNGAQLFMKVLKREGVKYVFNLVGGHIDPYYPAMLEEGIGIIDVRHEQAAALCAAAWSRLTGEPGVALVTAGPGVTNSVSGVAEAFYAGCPMIEIGGQTQLSEWDMGAPQNVDHVRLLRPITKWAATIYQTRRIPEYVSNAFRLAKSGTPGPVYLECPLNLLAEKVEESDVAFPENYYAEQVAGGSPAQVKEAVKLLMAARRPVVIASSGLFWAKGDKELRQFVEATEIPVQMIGLTRGAIPEDHPLALHPPTLAAVATGMADVVLALGAKFDFSLRYGRPPLFRADAKVIQVGVDPSLIGYNRGADIGIVGNPKTVLGQMIDEVKGTKEKVSRSAWLQEISSQAKTAAEELAKAYNADSLPIHPARLSKEVAEFLDKDAVIIPDGGDSAGGWFAPYVKAQYMGQLPRSGGLGLIGSGASFAIAAKLAKPDKQVLLFSGDGSFGLNGMEFDTMVRFNLPVVCVISNDSSWGMVRLARGMIFGEDKVAGSLLKPGQRYDKMVEALGGYGETVDRIEDIKPALARAFASGLPACINVPVDPKPMSAATMGYAQMWGLLGIGK